VSNHHSRKDCEEESISERSAALYFADDPSIAQLLLSHGARVRDFIMMSFLSDRGPLTINEVARIMSIEPSNLLKSVRCLTAAGLVIRDQSSLDPNVALTIRLTSRGQDIANRIND
jgi:DNA-binding MarR family transcriptional regulator